MNRSTRIRLGAFSLVEVVVAIGLVSFAFVAILAFFPTGLASNRSSVEETRAAQIARAVMGTIDSQCATFDNVQCYGLSLNLATLDKATTQGSPKLLYAGYTSADPSAQPQITNISDTNSIYTIELRFDNAPSNLSFSSGRVNQIELRVYGKSKTQGFVEFFYLARNKG